MTEGIDRNEAPRTYAVQGASDRAVPICSYLPIQERALITNTVVGVLAEDGAGVAAEGEVAEALLTDANILGRLNVYAAGTAACMVASGLPPE